MEHGRYSALIQLVTWIISVRDYGVTEMKKTILAFLFAGLFSASSGADIYVEGSVQGGGDDLIRSTTGDSISAGAGLKLAIGIQNAVTADQAGHIRLAVGYQFDRIDAANGDAELDTVTFDAMYVLNSGPHAMGAGVTMHMSPEYSDRIDGVVPLTIEFDDAVGFVVQYGYQFMPGLELGVRYTSMEYEVGSASVDADSFGIFLSNGY